jgi:hypothetical protein
MSWRREFSKLRWLFRRKEPTSDLEEEIRLHIRMEEQENVERGMSHEEAKYAARRRFGNVRLTREESSETWGWHALQTVAQDIRPRVIYHNVRRTRVQRRCSRESSRKNSFAAGAPPACVDGVGSQKPPFL